MAWSRPPQRDSSAPTAVATRWSASRWIRCAARRTAAASWSWRCLAYDSSRRFPVSELPRFAMQHGLHATPVIPGVAKCSTESAYVHCTSLPDCRFPSSRSCSSFRCSSLLLLGPLDSLVGWAYPSSGVLVSRSPSGQSRHLSGDKGPPSVVEDPKWSGALEAQIISSRGARPGLRARDRVCACRPPKTARTSPGGWLVRRRTLTWPR